MMARVPRTVRMRLTALYSVLFVVSAVVLLAITNGVGSTSSSATAVGTLGQTSSTEVHTSVSHNYFVGSLIALAVMAGGAGPGGGGAPGGAPPPPPPAAA